MKGEHKLLHNRPYYRDYREPTIKGSLLRIKILLQTNFENMVIEIEITVQFEAKKIYIADRMNFIIINKAL